MSESKATLDVVLVLLFGQYAPCDIRCFQQISIVTQMPASEDVDRDARDKAHPNGLIDGSGNALRSDQPRKSRISFLLQGLRSTTTRSWAMLISALIAASWVASHSNNVVNLVKNLSAMGEKKTVERKDDLPAPNRLVAASVTEPQQDPPWKRVDVHDFSGVEGGPLHAISDTLTSVENPLTPRLTKQLFENIRTKSPPSQQWFAYESPLLTSAELSTTCILASHVDALLGRLILGTADGKLFSVLQKVDKLGSNIDLGNNEKYEDYRFVVVVLVFPLSEADCHLIRQKGPDLGLIAYHKVENN